jgi:membrane-anchored protein YejM (alkaline phosphatase superfamily)
VYNRELLSAEAVRLLRAHAAGATGEPSPVYMYLAFMNVHNGCGHEPAMPQGDWRYQAPLDTVHKWYNTTVRDTYKVTGAMHTELDLGVGKVVAALKQTGMWNNTLVIFVSDNGASLSSKQNSLLALAWRFAF